MRLRQIFWQRWRQIDSEVTLSDERLLSAHATGAQCPLSDGSGETPAHAAMSLNGTKRTSAVVRSNVCFRGEADISDKACNVRF